MRLDLERVPGVELAVEESVQHDFGFGAGHVRAPSSAIHALRSSAPRPCQTRHHGADGDADDIGNFAV